MSTPASKLCTDFWKDKFSKHEPFIKLKEIGGVILNKTRCGHMRPHNAWAHDHDILNSYAIANAVASSL